MSTSTIWTDVSSNMVALAIFQAKWCGGPKAWRNISPREKLILRLLIWPLKPWNRKKALDLASIFATEYQDGQDRTYRWSYLAIRFLAEQEPQALVRLSQALKMDYFAGYEQELTALTSKEPAFQQWLQQLAQTAKNNDADTAPSIRKLNRYSYRDYLQPAHLSSSGRHQHY